jgi:hypothetical protein
VSTNERGTTVVEVLVAVVIVAVGLVALSAGLHVATAGVATGDRHTTAAFLAEQRLEDVRALALGPEGGQGWTNVTGATFGAEAYGAIAGFPAYRRTTSITAPAGSTTQKVVTVSVFWVPVGVASANAERSVTITALLASRS